MGLIKGKWRLQDRMCTPADRTGQDPLQSIAGGPDKVLRSWPVGLIQQLSGGRAESAGREGLLRGFR